MLKAKHHFVSPFGIAGSMNLWWGSLTEDRPVHRTGSCKLRERERFLFGVRCLSFPLPDHFGHSFFNRRKFFHRWHEFFSCSISLRYFFQWNNFPKIARITTKSGGQMMMKFDHRSIAGKRVSSCLTSRF